MEEKIIKEVLEAQEKYSKSKKDYEQKAEKFLKKFLEEHGGKFNVNDKLSEVPYVYYNADSQILECIIKDIFLEDDCIYADILARFHDGSPFDEPFEGVDFFEDLFHRGDIDRFIEELTDWQDDEADEEEDEKDNEEDPLDLDLEVTGEHNGHAFVDLGLPSGLLWATCNVGASKPEDCGDYFAWGETKPKENYVKDSYTYSDNQPKLPSEADAAAANWGEGWRLPSKDEMQELIDNCTVKTWYEPKGYLFTGPNGNSIFLPLAGYRTRSELSDVGSYGNYWSSSLNSGYPDYAWRLLFPNVGWPKEIMNSNYRYYGRSVRPVCTK